MSVLNAADLTCAGGPTSGVLSPRGSEHGLGGRAADMSPLTALGPRGPASRRPGPAPCGRSGGESFASARSWWPRVSLGARPSSRPPDLPVLTFPREAHPKSRVTLCRDPELIPSAKTPPQVRSRAEAVGVTSGDARQPTDAGDTAETEYLPENMFLAKVDLKINSARKTKFLLRLILVALIKLPDKYQVLKFQEAPPVGNRGLLVARPLKGLLTNSKSWRFCGNRRKSVQTFPGG